jgi:hypothetical protein
MRSRTLIMVALGASLAAGCATPEAKAVCGPVAGWATAFRCGGGGGATTAAVPAPEPSAPVAVAPPAEPVKPEPVKPEPEPEPAAPPPKIEM